MLTVGTKGNLKSPQNVQISRIASSGVPNGGNRGVWTPHFSKIWPSIFVQNMALDNMRNKNDVKLMGGGSILYACVNNNNCKMLCYLP